MRLADARAMANAAIKQYIPNAHNWTFDFDNSKRRFGCCHWGTRKITLSRKLVLMNDEAAVRDTILHEVAHAMSSPRAGHNSEWRRNALAIGCNGSRTYDSMAVAAPKPKYIGKCPNCPFMIRRHRRTNGSCPRCSGGRYNPAYKLRWA